jgi:tetratricopeptide (TPR) repeat protein
MRPSIAASRERLAGGPMLVGIGLAFGALLAAVLPTRGEYARSLERPSDARSIPYLRALTRASGGDEPIKLLYVRRLRSLGRFDAALEALGPETAGAVDAPTANLRFDLLLARARAEPEGSAARERAFAAVAGALERLRSVPETAPRLRELSNVALELEQPRLAAEYLLAVASLTAAGDRAPTLAEAGRWFRASHDDARAVDCFEQAADAAPDATKACAYAGSAIDALEAQERVDAAAELATSYAGRCPEDDALLARATLLAAAANHPTEARDLGRRLIAHRADDDDLQAQARRELAAEDPRGALAVIARLVVRHPEDAHLRQVEARVAEWAGNPALALGDWLWLFGRGIATPGEAALP